MGLRKTQNAFTGGEISPRLEGRTDLKQYSNSVAELENFFPHTYGGIAKAPGLYFCAETKDSTKKSRLIPFERKIGQAYMMEFGDYYIRFYRDGVLIRLGSAPAAYVGATTYAQGDLVSDGGINYYSMADSNTGNTPASSPTWWHALEDDIYEIPTPWPVADIEDLQHCQSVDVMWFTHGDYQQRKLSRYTETFWTITLENTIDGPFLPINPTTTQFLASASTGSVTITANSAAGINDNAGFLSTDVGRQIRLYNPDAATPDWCWMIITAVTDSTHVVATIQSGTAPTVTPTDLWRLGAFSDTTGWPRHCMFFQQRLAYAGTESEPQGVWLSQTDAYSLFSVSYPIVDSDACSFILVADQVNDINWMMSSRELAIGTLRGEWALSGAEGKVISPTSVNAKRYTTSGGTNIRPIHIESAVIFVGRAKRGLLEMAYVFEDDGYNAPDLLLLADHLTRESQIIDTAYQGHPDSKVYCVRDDGTLAVLTYKRKEEVVGWSRRTTQGLFESVATVSSSYRDVPYFIVNRTINGVTKRFVEYMKADFGDAVEDNPFGLSAAPPNIVGDLWVGALSGSDGAFYLRDIYQDLRGDGHPTDLDFLAGNFKQVYPGTNLDDPGIAGRIGVKIYSYYNDQFSTVINRIHEYNTFADTVKTWTITGYSGNSWFGAAAVLPDPTNNNEPVFFGCIYRNEVGGGWELVKGSFNDLTDEIELDWANRFSLEDDAPPTWDYENDLYGSSFYAQPKWGGALRITGNSTNILLSGLVKLRSGGTDPYETAFFIFDYNLNPVGSLETLDMGMVDGTPTFSPCSLGHLTDYYLLGIVNNHRDQYPNTTGFHIDIWGIVDDGAGGENYTRVKTQEFILDDICGTTGAQHIGVGACYALGQDIFLAYYTYSDGTFISKFNWNGSQITHVKTLKCSAAPTWSFGNGVPVFDIIADELLVRK